MSTHDRNLVFMMFIAAAFISLNFFAVITGAADALYEQFTLFLKPVLLGM
jgi:hypothetical protein